MSRAFLGAFFFGAILLAQEVKPPPLPLPEQEPPEEEESLKSKEYSLNPLKAAESITAGNYYFRKGNYGAARSRFREATLWDPGSPEAFHKLGEVDEKVRDFAGAKEAYAKYLELAPNAKDAEGIKKRLASWSKTPPKK